MARVTPAVAARIDELRAGGASKAAMLRALDAAGSPLNWRTLTRYLDRAAPVPTAMPNAPAEPAALERRAADALDGDDLGRLVRVRDDIDRALEAWRPLLGHDGSAVRAYAALARLHAEVTAKLVELRPRPEAEHDRLSALGEQARADLVARSVATASEDEVGQLRQQVADQKVVLARALDALADSGGEQ